MSLTLQQWHLRYQQQANWTRNLRYFIYNRVTIRNANRVLDVGCGTGVLLDELIHRSSGSVFGLDIDHNSILMAKNDIPKISLCTANGLHLPYRSGSFDICLCHFLLLWVKNPHQVVREMSRVTRHGGFVLALAEPDYGGRIDYPKSLTQLGKWQSESLAEQGANPLIGRELRSIFSASGLNQIEIGVLGGQWTENDPREDFEAEWDVIESDLENKEYFLSVYEELKSVDLSSRETQQRVLFVPTFYAIGKVNN